MLVNWPKWLPPSTSFIMHITNSRPPSNAREMVFGGYRSVEDQNFSAKYQMTFDLFSMVNSGYIAHAQSVADTTCTNVPDTHICGCTVCCRYYLFTHISICPVSC